MNGKHTQDAFWFGAIGVFVTILFFLALANRTRGQELELGDTIPKNLCVDHIPNIDITRKFNDSTDTYLYIHRELLGCKLGIRTDDKIEVFNRLEDLIANQNFTGAQQMKCWALIISDVRG